MSMNQMVRMITNNDSTCRPRMFIHFDSYWRFWSLSLEGSMRRLNSLLAIGIIVSMIHSHRRRHQGSQQGRWMSAVLLLETALCGQKKTKEEKQMKAFCHYCLPTCQREVWSSSPSSLELLTLPVYCRGLPAAAEGWEQDSGRSLEWRMDRDGAEGMVGWRCVCVEVGRNIGNYALSTKQQVL